MIDTDDKNILCGLAVGVLPVICSVIGYATGSMFTLIIYLIVLILMCILLNAPEKSRQKEKAKTAVISFPVFVLMAFIFQIYQKIFSLINPDYAEMFGSANAGDGFGLLFIWIPLSVVSLLGAIGLMYAVKE